MAKRVLSRELLGTLSTFAEAISISFNLNVIIPNDMPSRMSL